MSENAERSKIPVQIRQIIGLICERHFDLAQIDNIFVLSGCEQEWWVEPTVRASSEQLHRVNGWWLGIRKHAANEELPIAHEVCRSLLAEQLQSSDREATIAALERLGVEAQANILTRMNNLKNAPPKRHERLSSEDAPAMPDRESSPSHRGPSGKTGRDDNPQARALRQRQDLTLPDPALREQIKISREQWDFVHSQGLLPGAPPPKNSSSPTRSSHESTPPSSDQVPSEEGQGSSELILNLPRVFIGSSSEGLRAAKAIQANLDASDVAECVVWDQGVFGLSQGTLDALIVEAITHDFAVLVLTPDDVVEKRGRSGASPRDNVLFEVGFFMGLLGRDRTFMVARRDDDLHLPSDLAGVIRGRFREHSTGNLRAALGPFCSELDEIVRSRGIREKR